MGFSINTIYLAGNLTKDPVLKYTPGGKAVATFGVATNRSYKKEGDSEYTKIATFHNIVVWGSLAELVAKYLTKGEFCMIVGRQDHRTYTKQDGSEGRISEVVAEDVIWNKPKGENKSYNNETAPEPPDEPQPASSSVADDMPF